MRREAAWGIEHKEYLIFCDESVGKGEYFSNFYGGVRIGSSSLSGVLTRLNLARSTAGLTGEVKWSKTDAKCVARYEHIMSAFFNEISWGNIVARIMFTANCDIPVGLTQEHHNQRYFILYYQFLKHCFGLLHMPPHTVRPRLRIYLDEIGDTVEQVSRLRNFIRLLAAPPSHFSIADSDISEVCSHHHLLMQCIDVVLGAMAFKLNDKNKEIPNGCTVRGKRTIAKDRLQKFIHKQISRVTGKVFKLGSERTRPALWTSCSSDWTHL